MFKKLFQSKTAIVSVVTFLIAVTGWCNQLTHGFWGFIIPKDITLIIVGVGVITAEITNRFFPSGIFIGTGKNWTVYKYIGGIAAVLISLLQSEGVVNVLPADYGVVIVASIIPALQLIVRIFGGDTTFQVKAKDDKIAKLKVVS